MLTSPLAKRVLHYVEIFGAAFAVTILVNGEGILNAHGLSAIKSAAVAALIAAVKAGWDAVRVAVTGQ
jgi:hypothetical protein